MSRFRLFKALARHAADFPAMTRIAIIAVGIFVAGLVLVVVLDDVIGPPTDRTLAAAVATGG